MAKDDFYSRMTRLFRSGPSVRRRVKGQDYRAQYDKSISQRNLGYRGPAPFGRESSPFSALGGYGILDRIARYSEFSEMESMAEICGALDIYADETCATDEKGKSLHVYSENPQIKKVLEELFYDTLNVEFNLRPWVRNLAKFGDLYLYNEVVPDIGIINCTPLPVNELERDEGFDPEDPYAVRFKWLTRGNKILENWQVAHFRILGNDMFLPYGTSILDNARRIFRQLSMMEDAMLTYRVVRSPERRVFYIDVGQTAPNDIPSVMEAAKAALRSNTVTDKQTGRIDHRYNPVSIEEDYFIATRGQGTGTKVETLAGGQHVSATEDVEYLQKKLFAALKIPRAYLGYDETLSSKSTLAQEDIRFSRTINILQKIIIAEFNKLAMLHLYAKGFDGEDLVDFELFLSNPSSVAVQQKLALWNDRADIATKFKELGLVGEEWIQTEILSYTQEDINKAKNKRKEDVLFAKELEAIAVSDQSQERESVTDPFDQSAYLVPGADVEKNKQVQDQQMTDQELVKGISKFDSDGNVIRLDVPPGTAPVQATPYATRRRRNDKRRVGMGGDFNLASPDFPKMLDMGGKNKGNRDAYDFTFLKNNLVEEEEMKKVLIKNKTVPKDVKVMMEKMKNTLNLRTKKILIEDFDKKLDEVMSNAAKKKAFDTELDNLLLKETQEKQDESILDFELLEEKEKEKNK